MDVAEPSLDDFTEKSIFEYVPLMYTELKINESCFCLPVATGMDDITPFGDDSGIGFTNPLAYSPSSSKSELNPKPLSSVAARQLKVFGKMQCRESSDSPPSIKDVSYD